MAKSKELAPQVDVEDEPSAEWGWHGGFPRASLVAGWGSVAILLMFLIGNHTGRVEDLWLVGLAALMAYGLIRQSRRKRRAGRR